MFCPRIAITCGEPAGVGPEISVRAALETADSEIVLIGDAIQIKSLAAQIDPHQIIHLIKTGDLSVAPRQAGRIQVIDCPLVVRPIPGQLDPRNGRSVLQTLDIAIDGALHQQFDAIVTAPVQKSTINDAGVAFTGHTEYLAEKTNTAQVVMMLMGPSGDYTLRVALATTHLALKDVSAAITQSELLRTLEIIHHDLIHRFGISDPRILVAGLNPHAGEGGYLGREEIDVIQPVINQCRSKNWQVYGPYPADTLFQSKYLKDADCVLAMYHDQGLPVLKFATFGEGVNITLGLPIIRTSVDHGTALDIAEQGLGLADHSSMSAALRAAIEMIHASHSTIQ
jgi:4-hydroxythreonine-4-phosphate dehydrogenase